MTKNIFYNNRIIFFSVLAILIIAGSVAFGNRAFSYEDTITHPSLTGNIAKVYNVNFERKLSDEEINWLKQGSVEEDLAPRWLNHFYDPNTNQGLWGNFPSKQWARDSLAQALARGGNQTWQKAIDSYVKDNKEEAFYALGHILHLLEDSTVPAHTRLDAHPEGDPYEGWAMNKIGWSINFSVAPVAVNSLNAAFDGLASYSSENFLSKDTIQLSPSFKEEIIDKRIFLLYQDQFGNKYKILEKTDIGGKSSYALSDSVHSDYFSLLAPKAISYGAGVVKLFFDEAEKKKQAEQNKTWWQKLQEGASNWLTSISGSLYAGIGTGDTGSVAPSPAPPAGGAQDEAPGNTAASNTPIAAPLLPSTVIAGEKIAAPLPANTVMAQEKANNGITEDTLPQNVEVPPAIVEEINPSRAKLPSPSPTPALSFLSGGGGPAITPLSAVSESPTPTPTPTPDTTLPETTIISSPASAVATTTAIFEFSSSKSDSTFSCQLDNATSTVCVSPKEYANLAEGSHTFKVSAKDAAGNEDATPAEYSWIIDLSALQLSGIASVPGRTSALISWIASESGIFKIEYGTSTSYGLVTATTSVSNLTVGSLSPNTDYHFRILAQDSLANATTSDDGIFTTINKAENVVISEIKTVGSGGANDEWIELYNPTSQAIDISGWSIQYRGGASGAFNKKNFTTTSSVPVYGFFLIANSSGYQGGVPADMSQATFSMSADGGNVFLVNDHILLNSATSTAIVDKISYGAGSNLFPEGEVPATAPSAAQSLERKANATSTAALLINGAHQWQGNGYDSDNNSQDFVLQTNPNPQNSLMLTEPRSSLPGLMDSSWPTWQGNLARAGQTSVASLATSTMAVKWTAMTTATHEFISRPVLDGDGNIYIGRADGLAKYLPNGNLIWLYATDAIYTTPLIISDGTIYFRGSGALFAVNQNGQLILRYVLDGTGGSNAALAILFDGAIITQSAEKITAINQDATLKWSFDSGRAMNSSNSIGAFVIDSADNIYVTIDNYIYALDKDGAPIWDKNYGAGYTSLALGADNTLYVSAASWISGMGYQGGFYALNADDGSTKWSDTSGFNDHAELAPVVDPSGRVYLIMFYGGAWVSSIKLQSYNATTSLVNAPSWAISVASSHLAAPILTNDGKIYLADQNSLKIFDAASGNLDYAFDTGDNSFYLYFGAVGSDGTIYAASNSALYAIGTGG